MAGTRVGQTRDHGTPTAVRWAWASLEGNWIPGVAGLNRLWRSHRLFIVAAAISLLPRALAALAYRPGMFMPDTFSYLHDATHHSLGEWHPAGYPILLAMLQPFHSLLLVTTVQHLMGIGMAGIVYGVMRQWGLPAWGAVLAAAPTLFDPRQIMLESLVAADTFYAFLVVAAVGILLTRRAPVWWQAAAAGLLIAWCSLVRGNGPAVIVAVIAYLLIRRVGWRALAAGIAGFAVPLLGYMAAYSASHGTFGTTSTDGLFLWSRTMSFANCAVIKPPPQLRPLCPDRQPGPRTAATPAWSVSSLLRERTPQSYLWNSRAWWLHDGHPGYSPYNNSLALQFALDAIRAQPFDYARTVSKEVLLTFLATDRPESSRTLYLSASLWNRPVLTKSWQASLRSYTGGTGNIQAVQPYAYFFDLYQQPVFFPGVVFLLTFAVGLCGMIRRWRCWGGPGTLPWVAGVTGIVVPPALHQYDYRFAISCVPLACLAAGLTFVRRPAVPSRAEPDQAATAASTGASQTAPQARNLPLPPGG